MADRGEQSLSANNGNVVGVGGGGGEKGTWMNRENICCSICHCYN